MNENINLEIPKIYELANKMVRLKAKEIGSILDSISDSTFYESLSTCLNILTYNLLLMNAIGLRDIESFMQLDNDLFLENLQRLIHEIKN